jgi:hypothetical protein
LVTKKPKLKIVRTPTTTGPTPPRELGEHGMTLWTAIMSEYRIDDYGGIEVLAQVCAALDRAEELSRQIDTDGPTIMSKTGMREHPSIKGELGCRSFVVRGLQRLGITLEAVKPIGRPPGPRSA